MWCPPLGESGHDAGEEFTTPPVVVPNPSAKETEYGAVFAKNVDVPMRRQTDRPSLSSSDHRGRHRHSRVGSSGVRASWGRCVFEPDSQSVKIQIAPAWRSAYCCSSGFVLRHRCIRWCSQSQSFSSAAHVWDGAAIHELVTDLRTPRRCATWPSSGFAVMLRV